MKLIKTHTFIFNPGDNGGEQVRLVTQFFHNGDTLQNGDKSHGRKDPKGLFLNQELTLSSYCNSASFTLVGAALNPDQLEHLAKALRAAQHAAELEIASENEVRLPESRL